jgi:hypothetical protein
LLLVFQLVHVLASGASTTVNYISGCREQREPAGDATYGISIEPFLHSWRSNEEKIKVKNMVKVHYQNWLEFCKRDFRLFGIMRVFSEKRTERE